MTVLVHASAKLQADDHPMVAIYDGPPSDGEIVAVTRMSGIDDQTGGHVSFSWTPTTPGLHQLHQVLLGTSATGEDDEQIMNVNVAAPLTQYTVQASASATSVHPGDSVTITGTTSPVLPTASQRQVELQRQVATAGFDQAQWQTVDTLETNSRGEFTFPVTAPEGVGTYTYRVWKTLTAGRPGAASPPITLKVGTTTGPPPPPPVAMKITLNVDKHHVERGTRVRFSGKALPWPGGSMGLVLQARKASHWTDVTNVKVDNRGRFVLRMKTAKQGTFHYRVREPSSGSISKVVVVVVRK